MKIRSPQAILLVLTLINLFNYIDRFVLAAVLPRMQESIALSNFEGGLLGSAFMLGYMFFAPFFGFLGDRFDRRYLLALGIFLWSLATVATGFAGSFKALLFTRIVVGVGEASYAAIAPTLIDDLFDGAKKNSRLAIFFMAIPVGSALGYLAGGSLEKFYGWREAFYIVGAPGLVLATGVLFIKNLESKRPRHQRSYWSDLRELSRRYHYWLLSLGYAAYTFAIGGLAFWAPKYLFSTHQMPLVHANTLFGTVTVISGIAGTLLGGALAPRFLRRFGLEGYARFSAWTTFAAVPFAVLALATPSANQFFIWTFVAELFLFLSTAPINAGLLASVSPAIRASAMAINIFLIHLLGDLISPSLMGKIADLHGLPWGMALFPVAVAICAVLWLWAARVKIAAQEI